MSVLRIKIELLVMSDPGRNGRRQIGNPRQALTASSSYMSHQMTGRNYGRKLLSRILGRCFAAVAQEVQKPLRPSV